VLPIEAETANYLFIWSRRLIAIWVVGHYAAEAALLLAAHPSFVFWSRQGIYVTSIMAPLALGGLLWQFGLKKFFLKLINDKIDCRRLVFYPILSFDDIDDPVLMFAQFQKRLYHGIAFVMKCNVILCFII